MREVGWMDDERLKVVIWINWRRKELGELKRVKRQSKKDIR